MAVAILVAAASLAGATGAQAGTLTRLNDGSFTFIADAGIDDSISVGNGATGTFTFADSADPVLLGTGTGCVASGTNTVTCPVGPRLTMLLEDGDDTTSVADTVPMSYSEFGDTGVDRLDGGDRNDTLSGGDGNDTLLSGDRGDDLLIPGAGTDTNISGSNAGEGADSDTISYNDGRTTSVVVDVGAGTGGDGETFTRVENATGGLGNDTLRAGSAVGVTLNGGNAGEDNLTGGTGNDTLDGGSDTDTLRGGGGDDTLIGGSSADVLFGDAGTDTVSYRERSSAVSTSLLATEGRQDGDSYSTVENLEGGRGRDTLRGDATPNAISGGDGDDTLIGNLGADTLNGGAGKDMVSYDDGRATAVVTTLGAGPRQDGDTYADIQDLAGGDGSDTLTGDDDANLLLGGNGADTLIGAGGADTLNGGLANGADASLDVASYAERTAPVSATLGGTVPDGDTYVDIGGLEGGAGDDTLTGDGATNLLRGGAGNDTITGAAGADALDGGAGSDTLEAQDGEADGVNCGPDADTANADLADTLSDCEARNILGAVIDVDSDGSPAGVDCNDANAAVRPGAAEVPGNGVDENCDGRDAPRRLNIGLTFGFNAFRNGTVLTELHALRLPRGATLRILCKGKRSCPFKRRDTKVKKATARLNIVKPFKRRKLPPGAKVTVIGTAPNAIGKQFVLTIRAGKRPQLKTTCVTAGRKKTSCR